MNQRHLVSVLALALAALLPVASAGAAQLLEPVARDQVPASLARPAAMQMHRAPGTELEHRLVQVSRPLDSARKLAPAPQPYQARSREYWMTVDADQLAQGVELATTAARAVVRVSPVADARELESIDLAIAPPNGTAMPLKRAVDSIADSDDLHAVGMQVASGAKAFVLSPRLGSGRFVLSSSKAEGRYLIHVLDAHSTLKVGLQASRATVLDGGVVRLRLAVTDAGHERPVTAASGMVVAPDGATFALTFKHAAGHTMQADFVADASHSRGPELWRAQAFVETEHGGLGVSRDVRTAFAVSAPTARFSDAVTVTQGDNGIAFEIGIRASHASRYQVSGVLYGTAADGAMHPAALAQAAAWREAGSATLPLAFSADAIHASDVHAPWELRDLRLVDQGTMQLLERRSRAMIVN